MTTYNTGNPVPSTDVRDLYDNAENFDTAVNDRTSRTWVDRLGDSRKSWWGIEQDFQDFLLESGYVDIGDYAAGLVIAARNQTFAKDGELYRAGPGLALPYTTTGDWDTEGGNFVSIGDAQLRQDLAAPTGATLVGYRRNEAGAALRSQAAVNADTINAADFEGLDPSGTTDSYAAIMAAIAACNARGGGTVKFPRGRFLHSQPIYLGDGSATQVSTRDHRITLVGEGIGSHDGQDFVQQQAPTEFVYTGPAITGGSFQLRGPLHAVGLHGFTINAQGNARGLDIIHVADAMISNIVTKRATGLGWLLTTRSAFPPGCTYGCGNNMIYHCYNTMPATVDTGGILMTSGVSEAVSLTGAPDTANCDIIGGAYFYGGSANSFGIRLHGADNNIVSGAQFIKAVPVSFGYSVKFTQWAGDTRFPMENVFINLGSNDPVGGQSGTLGNTFLIHQEGDGSPLPVMPYVNARTHSGIEAVQGKRVYRVRSVQQLTLAATNVDTTSSTFVPVPALGGSITGIKAGAKLRISLSAQVSKLTGGFGLFIIYVNGVAQGATQTSVPFNQFAQNTSANLLFDAPTAGDYFVGLYFASNDGNICRVTNGILTIEELF